MRRIINSIILLAIMAIALPSYGQGLKAFKLKEWPFRIYMGRQHQIGCIWYCGLPNRLSERSGRIYRTGTLPGARNV